MSDTAYSPLKLRELIATQGRTVNWLAVQTDYEPDTISRYLNGAYPISEKFAQRAAKALQVPVTWLQERQAVEVAA